MEGPQCNLAEYGCICSVVANVATVLLFHSLNAGVKKRLKEIMDLSLLKKSKGKKIKLSKADAREKCEKLNNQRCDSFSSIFDKMVAANEVEKCD